MNEQYVLFTTILRCVSPRTCRACTVYSALMNRLHGEIAKLDGWMEDLAALLTPELSFAAEHAAECGALLAFAVCTRLRACYFLFTRWGNSCRAQMWLRSSPYFSFLTKHRLCVCGH